MKAVIDRQEIIDNLESNIIMRNKRKLENPKCPNNTYAQFITVGEISMLEKFGIIDESTSLKYIEMAKGRFAKEIIDMYNNKSSNENVDDLISFYNNIKEACNLN